MSENNTNREIAIKLSGVKKQYKLGQIGGGTLTADIQSWWARKRGKEDPNTKIGADQRLIGKTFMALNGIDLTVYKGEALGIIGGNGAGKSTMLKLLSRVTAPTEGEIDIYGRITSMLEVGTGFNGELTGRENVYMNGAILGMTKAEIDAKMEDIIEFSEVREFIDTPVKRYSSGMYVKLAFSVAAHLDSEIMIMDEVLAVGDMAFQKKCLDKMRDAAKKEGRTVLYVSHNMNTIRQLCDRCVVLDQGKVVFEGEVEDGIGRYLGTSGFNSTLLQCKSSERPKWISAQKIQVDTIEFLQKREAIFHDDEKIILRIHWENLFDVDNMGLLIEICNSDDIAQASYVLYNFYSGKQNEFTEAILSLNTHGLMSGTYFMRFTFFIKNSYGNGMTVDWVSGLQFTKNLTPNDLELTWHTKQWGSIKMPTPTLISIN